MHSTTALRNRALRLGAQSGQVHPLLATAYRRRAAELRLEAWLQEVFAPDVVPC